MRTALAVLVAVGLVLLIALSFSDELGLDLLMPELEIWKTTFVGVVFLLVAMAGLFHRINKRKSDD